MNIKENFNLGDFLKAVYAPISGDPSLSKLEAIWSAVDYLKEISE